MHYKGAVTILEPLTHLIRFIFEPGNPRVTPEVTRDVCLLARLMAANLYFSQIEELMFEVWASHSPIILHLWVS